MLLWILGTVLLLGMLAYFVVQANKRTCMRAYLQGVNDAGILSFPEVGQRYKGFLTPMRPMDAAAYQRGIEYALTSTTSDWRDMKSDFLDGYKSGVITREGTGINGLGAELAAANFRLRISQELEDFIRTNPDLPLLASKITLEEQHSQQPTN